METNTETTPVITPADGSNTQGLPTAADIAPAIQTDGNLPPGQAPPAKPANTLGAPPGTDPLAPPANTLGAPPEPKSPEQPLETQVKAEGVPDSYKAFDNAPEGFAMDQATTELFQKAALTQEGAQVIIDGLRERQGQDAMLRQQQLGNMHIENQTLLKQDVEFGGMHYEETLKDSRAGMNRITQMLGNDNLWKAIEGASLQTDPGVVKLFAMIEKWHGEKGWITGETNSPEKFGNDPATNLGIIQAQEIKAALAG